MRALIVFAFKFGLVLGALAYLFSPSAYALATDPGPVGALSKVQQNNGSFTSNYTSGLNYWCIEPATTQCGGQYAGGWIAVYPYGYWAANSCGWGGSGPIVWKKWGELTGDWCSQNAVGNWVKATFPAVAPPEPPAPEPGTVEGKFTGVALQDVLVSVGFALVFGIGFLAGKLR